MKTALKILAFLLVGVIIVGGGVLAWASVASSSNLGRSIDSHRVDFPVPFPLSDEERDGLGLTEEEAEQVALERALERGRHLVEARYACTECHGIDFSGGVMVDAFPIGRLLGPNLTAGRGSVTAAYSPADWDRIVRHGIRSDGRPTVMPSEDFFLMSDQELSDIVTYIRAAPPVDNEVPPVRLGPLGKVLLATGQLHISADMTDAHDTPHGEVPPPAEVSLEFGRHLAAVCTGCHGSELAGGKIPGGDPSWLPAANLTPHAEGLAEWDYENFAVAMRDGVRPDGTEIGLPMTMIKPYAQQMTDVEMEAIWLYLQSLPGRATPK